MKKNIFIFLILFSFTAYSQITILEENFENSTLPSEWSVINNDGFTPAAAVQEYTDAWIITEDPFDATNNTVSSTSYFSPVNRADRWLITPKITLGIEGNFISWKGLSYDPSFPDSYKVMISTTENKIADFTDTLIIITNETPTWINRTFALDKYAEKDIYIAFVNTTYDGFKLYLDSVYVREHDPLKTIENTINLSVYPNPVTTNIHISSHQGQLFSIQIYNGAGQLIEKHKITGTHATQSLVHLEKGIYFIEVNTERGVIRKKIIKK